MLLILSVGMILVNCTDEIGMISVNFEPELCQFTCTILECAYIMTFAKTVSFISD